MKFLKYFIPSVSALLICHIIASQILPVDSNNYLIAPDWYIFLLIGVSAIPPIAMFLYQIIYFHSAKFKEIKASVSTHISDCNNLNRHIEQLKDITLVSNRVNYGSATYTDDSKWNMARTELRKRKNEPLVYNCSRTVCDNASKEPFKYICKYFGIHADENTLSVFEAILNNFEAVEEGKKSLLIIRKEILRGIAGEIPWDIRVFWKNELQKKLGFEPVDFSTVHFPKYVFQYVSSGGNASTKCEITMDIKNLNDFILYLSERIRFSKSVAAQRALMTSRLRTYIKERDGYTCRYCGASVSVEPNLLLEIDHIIPVSKGGLTTESNLQTLCWRCNRSKGAKLQNASADTGVPKSNYERTDLPSTGSESPPSYCTKCGTKLPENANFCTRCGATCKLTGDASSH